MPKKLYEAVDIFILHKFTYIYLLYFSMIGCLLDALCLFFSFCFLIFSLFCSYNIVFMILTYILPIISMTVTYSRVGIELWGSKAIGEYTPRQVENVKSKRRVSGIGEIIVFN